MDFESEYEKEEEKKEIQDMLALQMEALKDNPEIMRQIVETQKAAMGHQECSQCQFRDNFLRIVSMGALREDILSELDRLECTLHNAIAYMPQILAENNRGGSIGIMARQFIVWQYKGDGDPESEHKPEWIS